MQQRTDARRCERPEQRHLEGARHVERKVERAEPPRDGGAVAAGMTVQVVMSGASNRER